MLPKASTPVNESFWMMKVEQLSCRVAEDRVNGESTGSSDDGFASGSGMGK